MEDGQLEMPDKVSDKVIQVFSGLEKKKNRDDDSDIYSPDKILNTDIQSDDSD